MTTGFIPRWLDTPIGLHNRKFFVLYLTYASLLCAYGATAAYRSGDPDLRPYCRTDLLPRDRGDRFCLVFAPAVAKADLKK